MNKLYRFLERILNIDDVVIEEPKITTKSMREKIEHLREEDVEREEQIAEDNTRIKESLQLFPINFPASATEIALAHNSMFTPSMQVILNELVSEEEPSWEYIQIDGCTHYQRVK